MSQIQLPGTAPVQGYQTGTEGSMAAAGAPWAALVGLGHDVSRLGEQTSQTLVKLQRVENQKQDYQFKLKADQLYHDFMLKSLQNPTGSPLDRIKEWNKISDDFIKANVAEGFAPEQQALLGQSAAAWASRTRKDVAENAVIANIKESRAARGNLLQQRINIDDEAGAYELIDGAEDLSPAEKEHQKLRLGEQFETQRVIRAAEENPKRAMEELKAKNQDGTWSNYKNLDPSSRNRAISAAEQNYRTGTFDDVERFNNGLLDGSISKPEQIDAKFPNISDTLKKRWKEVLEHEITDAERKYMATPEYQQTTVGKVSSLMDNYSVELNGFDEQFDAMDRMIRTLPEGPAKARLNYRLDDIRKGQLKEWKESADEWRDKLSGSFKSGSFGLGVVRKSTQQLINEGLLLSPEKLTATGMSQEQAQKVIEAKPAERVNVFRKQYGERAGESTNDPITAYALDQIGSKSGEGFVDFPDAKLQKEAEEKYGTAVDEFEKWYRVNKDANYDTLEKKFYSLLSPEGTKRFSETILPPIDGPGVLPPYPDGK